MSMYEDAVHAIEKRAMAGDQRSVLLLVDLERKLRTMIEKTLDMGGAGAYTLLSSAYEQVLEDLTNAQEDD